MVKRAIHLFPRFENMFLIDQLREAYDPLYSLIRPHITLVFPFESDLSSEVLKTHMKYVTKELSPFSTRLQGITGTPDQYLFLNVKQGNDRIIQLHDQLYTDSLVPFLSRRHSYLPHLTVGQLSDSKEFEQALMDTKDFTQSFSTIINELQVELIDNEGYSHVDFTIQF